MTDRLGVARMQYGEGTVDEVLGVGAGAHEAVG